MDRRVVGAILLVAGTCVGAVTLALPVSIAPLGFLTTLGVFCAFWLMMWLSGLMVLEANLRLPESSSFISMARATLGRPGEWLSWCCYLLLLYSLLAAYLSGGGDLLLGLAQTRFQTTLPSWQAALPWVIVIAILLYRGIHDVAMINRVLVGGLIITFVILAVMMSMHLQFTRLAWTPPTHILPALPILITAFGYQVIIPSLRKYLRGDVHKLRQSIFWGSLLPLLVYIIWATDVFGVIPLHGSGSLAALNAAGQPARDLPQIIVAVTEHAGLLTVVQALIFFALASSFLGIALSLFDFLSDGVPMPNNRFGRLFLALLTILPPWIYAAVYPKGFVIALSYAGIFVAVLNGILPAAMAMRGRTAALDYRTPGAWLSIGYVTLLSGLVIVAECTGRM